MRSRWLKPLSRITLVLCVLMLATQPVSAEADAAPEPPHEGAAVVEAQSGAEGAAETQLLQPVDSQAPEAEAAEGRVSTPKADPEAASDAAIPRPTSAEEPASKLVTQANVPQVRLVENDGAAVTLHIRQGADWKPLCTAPCTFAAPMDPADYALSGPSMLNYKARVAAKNLWLAPGDGLQAKFKSRRSIRATGAALMGLGLLMSAWSLVALPSGRAAVAWFGSVGVAVTLGGTLALLPDRYTVSRCVGCAQPR